MQYLFRQGKSAQFTTIICTHHPLKIPQSLLQSIDYYFAAADPTTLRTLTGLYGTKDYSEIRLAVGDNIREFEFIVLQKNRINSGEKYKNISDDEAQRLYGSSTVHEKPLVNALGPNFKDVLNFEKVLSLYKRM